MNIPERWRSKLETLPPKDFKILIMAILNGEDEPSITPRYQYVASDIYADIRQLQQANDRVKKSRLKRYRNVTETVTETLPKHNCNVTETLLKQQEERKEDTPLSPPLFPSPTPLSNYPPIIPPEEKREEDTPSKVPPTAEAEPREPSLESRFEELWKLYPKKAGKVTAYKDYQQAVKDGVTDEEIADGISRYNEHIRISRTEPKYILQGSTYFHQRRWEDEFSDSGTPTLTAEELEELHAVFG